MKMLKIVLLFLFFSMLLVAQESNESQNIELPEFVITGVQKISIPSAQKIMPDLIIPLSDSFFYLTDIKYDFNPAGFTKILKAEPNLINFPFVNNGLLKGSIGSIAIPKGEFYFGKNIGDVLFTSQILGQREREFVNGAGYNYLKFDLGGMYFINHNASILPGMGISIKGNYKIDSYKLYGSDNPDFLRKTNIGNFLIELFNYFTPINYSLRLSNNYLKIHENSLVENLFTFSTFIKIPLNIFNLKADFQIKNQNVENNSGISNNNYFATNLEADTRIFKNMILKGGIFYSSGINNTFLSIKASILMKLMKKLSLFAEFYPHSEFMSIQDFIILNRFYSIKSSNNLFVRYKNNLNAELKYGYFEFFEIGLEAGYSRIDNFPYFVKKPNMENLELFSANGVDKYYFGINLLFHNTLGGKIYSSLKYQSLNGINGNQLPYYPKFDLDFNYYYSITNDIDLKIKLKFMSDLNVNEENTDKLTNYINIGANVSYNFIDNLKFTLSLENLLNRKNYLYEDYRDNTLDLSAGVEYRW